MRNNNDEAESTYNRSSVKQIRAMLEQQSSTSKPLPKSSESQDNSTLKITNISRDEMASIGSSSRSSFASSNSARFPPIPAKPQALRSGSIKKNLSNLSITDQDCRRSIYRPSLNDNNSVAEITESHNTTPILSPIQNLSIEETVSSKRDKIMNEIIETEKSFLSDMQVLNEVHVKYL